MAQTCTTVVNGAGQIIDKICTQSTGYGWSWFDYVRLFLLVLSIISTVLLIVVWSQKRAS